MEKGKSKQVSLFPTPTMQHHYNKALKKHTTHAAMGKQLRAKTPERVNNGDEKKHVASGTLQGVSFLYFFMKPREAPNFKQCYRNGNCWGESETGWGQTFAFRVSVQA